MKARLAKLTPLQAWSAYAGVCLLGIALLKGAQIISWSDAYWMSVLVLVIAGFKYQQWKQRTSRNDSAASTVETRSNSLAAPLNDPQQEAQFLLAHAAHDYEQLVRRWQAVAEAAGLEMTAFANHGDYPVYGLRGQGEPGTEQDALYCSAGIHGDEAASTLGLITWAEANVDVLRQRPSVIFPCLNPWGLVQNRRSDEQGVDLNRLFHSTDHPFIQAWSEFVGETRIQLALLLHEDYDAPGLYVYEVSEPGPSIGEAALLACESLIPRHPGAQIEGRDAERGLIRVTGEIEKLAQQLMEEEAGLPEALCLRQRGTRFCLTFETPSEYSLFNRVRTQVRFIESALEKAGRVDAGID